MTDIVYYPRRAVQDTSLPLSARRFLLALCLHYEPQDSFTLSLSDIKRQASVSPDTFRQAKAALLDAAYLVPAGRADCQHPCYRFQREQALELDRGICTRLLTSGLTSAAAAVFLYLYDRQNAKCPEASLAEIRRHTGVSHSNLCIMLKDLSEAGLLQIERRQELSGQHFSNRYYIPGQTAEEHVI